MAPLKLGMVGGGRGAFIGAVHRKAAVLDGDFTLVAGALSSTPEKSKASGRDLGLADERNYGSWEEMLDRELARPEGERIDVLSIVTPNHLHFPVAYAFAEAGFNVVCDKPMVTTSDEAARLVEVVEKTGVTFAVTYNYTGYPLVKQARQMVREGRLGELRKVVVTYHQGWLATKLEDEGVKQAVWRADPDQAGIAGAMGDIGSHAENLVATVTGLEPSHLCADLTTFVPGRALDDDGNLLLRFRGGAKGVLVCSQISTGEENNLSIRVYGTKGGLSWHQETPNQLLYRPLGSPAQRLTPGQPYLADAAQKFVRIPSGHPEGFIEAFANIYRSVAATIRAKRDGGDEPLQNDFPTVHDGARGVRFIETTVASSQSEKKWLELSP
ncbi:MAG: Gfo/Idh/MocA family oxidoreductase [Trueperaceae bacterium]|nr:Gfo/Idh/MocA family oxidoreductase [Trueperaceae bacterium]